METLNWINIKRIWIENITRGFRWFRSNLKIIKGMVIIKELISRKYTLKEYIWEYNIWFRF